MDFISTVHPVLVTNIFLLTTALIAILGISFRFKFNNRLIESLPGLAVSLGILGTFIGIFLGLYNFNVQNIDTSVPELLEGLKTAFLTSIAGMIASLTMRLFYDFQGGREDKKVDYEDPLPVLIEIMNNAAKIKENSDNTAQIILKCFKSDEEYSLISQVKLIRQEMIDSRRETRASLDYFAQKLTEASTDTLVKALEKVIDDFNTLLGELVGETFKELSTAMINLNKWQENYQLHIETTESRLTKLISNTENIFIKVDVLVEKFDQMDQSLHITSKSLDKITISSKTLEASADELSKNNEMFKTSLEQVRKLGIDSKEVLPSILRSMEILQSTLEETVHRVSNQLGTSTADFVKTNTDTMNTFISNISQSNQSFSKRTDELERHLEQHLNLYMDTMKTTLTTTIEKLSAQLESSTLNFVDINTTNLNNFTSRITAINDSLHETTRELEKHLEKQLNQSLDSLASALGTLSNKFVNDYSPLTDKLRKIIEISEKINEN